jgi:CheY-like chemotaxis protein
MKDESNAVSILFLTTDLVFSSRVAGAAARAGLSLRTVASQTALLETAAAAQADLIVLLDLNSPSVDPADIVPALRAAPHRPQAIIAYGPHVHEDRLAAATAAGCDEVLTRGEFNATMDDVLRKWLSS